MVKCNYDLANFKLTKGDFFTDKSDVLILPVYQDELSKKSKLSEDIKNLNKHIDAQFLKDEDFTGKLNQVLHVGNLSKLNCRQIILLGLGKQSELTSLDQVRKAYSIAIRKAQALKATTVSIKYITASELNEESLIQAITEICLLATYDYKRFKSDDKSKNIKTIKLITADTAKKAQKDAINKAVKLAEGVNLARDLVISPPNEVNPVYLAKIAQEMGKQYKDNGLTVKVMGEKECEKLGMGAFLAVGQGSANESQFMHFHYKPKTKKKLKHLAFVGKGVTFDTGGLSLKPANAMLGMKYDMAGSATVFGLMQAVAELQPDIEITGIVAAAENMPSSNAYRPNDILTSMKGTTIEILNTDAEGRVTLADAVHYANLQKPDLIVDIATLTGAVVVALGELCAGVMTNNQEVLDKFIDASKDAGEKMWQLPLYDEHEDCLKKGTIADIINTGSKGQAGSQNGGVFVKQFVGDTPWIHIDIAGICWPELFDTPLTTKNNPSGYGILTAYKYIENLLATK